MLALVGVALALTIVGVIAIRHIRCHLAAIRRIGNGDLETPCELPALEEMRMQLRGRAAFERANARLLAERVAELERSQCGIDVSDRMASIGMLAAGIAQELSNPMINVVSSLQLAQELVPPSECDDDLAGLVAEARKASDRVVRILLDLKLLSRGLSIESRGVAVATSIDRVLDLAACQLRRSCRVVRDEDPELPLAAGEDQRLVQVLHNLIVNAVQAFPTPDTRRNTITIRTRKLEHELLLAVEDNGAGIAPEHLGRIFEPFFSTRPAGQAGLGLSICHNLIEAMGGKLAVRSTVGRGTTIEIRLGIRQAVSAPLRTSEPLIQRPRPTQARLTLVP